MRRTRPHHGGRAASCRRSRLTAPGAALLALSGIVAGPGAAHAQAAAGPPSIVFDGLFQAVQLAPLYPDQKTFCDLVPRAAPLLIDLAYDIARRQKGFSLSGFVGQAFSAGPAGPVVPLANGGEPIRSYIDRLWSVLTVDASSVPRFSSLLSLPRPFVVPGGRFNELYYWDTFFDVVGLERSGRGDLSDSIVADFASEIDRFGHVPNGNRTYYLSRSQPPFFATLLAVVARRRGPDVFRQYLPELRAEHAYWMRGADALSPGQAAHNAVRLWDGTLLNRYWDERDAPRDESYAEDIATAQQSSRAPARVYRDLRAAAESGWDFSSRWLADGKTLSTIRTTDIVPADLNSLLYGLEQGLAEGERLAGNQAEADRIAGQAETRASAIRRLMWDDGAGAFDDLVRQTGRSTGIYSAATVYPLVFGIASARQAHAVAMSVRARLLQPGGLATTTVATTQQWDFPNGWAPLQWLAVEGFRRYGEDALAHRIAANWTANVAAGYAATSKLVEKYDVTRTDGGAGGGGEYATQIGFGWTNGVQLGLYADYPDLEKTAPVPAATAGALLTVSD